jgi:uncharacterized iron-regulated protein
MPTRLPATLVASISAIATLACQPASTPKLAQAPAAAFRWESTVERKHPLVGTIYDRSRDQTVQEQEFGARAATTHFVLLGEKHDNPDHHRLQAASLQALIDAGRRPMVALEMIERGRQELVNKTVQAHPDQPEALGSALDWDDSGWPPFAIYQPIFAAALRARLPILAANVPAVQVRLIVRHGSSAFAAGQLQLWGLDRPLAEPQLAALKDELRQSHCGMLPERVVEGMVLAQRARDAGMADRLLETDGPQGAVLIAGGGHVRRDRGVPLYLSTRRPTASILSIAWVEVQSGVDDPRAYDTGTDYVWFTPRVDNDDPCQKFKQQLHSAARR